MPVLKQVLDWSCGIYIFFLWNEMFCINRRDLALKRNEIKVSEIEVQPEPSPSKGLNIIQRTMAATGPGKSSMDIAPEVMVKI